MAPGGTALLDRGKQSKTPRVKTSGLYFQKKFISSFGGTGKRRGLGFSLSITGRFSRILGKKII